MKVAFKFSKAKIAESLSEMLGSFLFLFTLFVSPLLIRSTEPFLVGLLFIVVMMAASNFSKGHINPIFSMGEYFVKLIEQVRAKKFILADLWEFLMYIVSQFVGALLAFGCAWKLRNPLVDFQIVLNSLSGTAGIKDTFLSQLKFGTTFNGDFTTVAFLIEMFFVFALVMIWLFNSTNAIRKNFTPFLIGLALFGFTVMATDLTGASFNPIRSLVPALFLGGDELRQVWLYLLAPFLGALIAAVVYYVMRLLTTAAPAPAVKAATSGKKK
jgi:aquaporin Z